MIKVEFQEICAHIVDAIEKGFYNPFATAPTC